MSIQIATPEAAEAAVKELWKEKARREREKHEMAEAARRCKKFYNFFPDEGQYRRGLYPKHMEFFAAGAIHRERAFIAGNRVGKTECGAYEMTAHLTGEYPKWWQGRRFEKPLMAWACGDTNTTVRDILQRKLIGPIVRTPGMSISDAVGIGTGMIPGKLIKSVRNRPGIPDAIETVYVNHVSGGVSVLTFKSYETGRESFQGTEQDVIWLDEESDLSIYTECLLRTMTNSGICYLTFTPLRGLSDVVLSFIPDGNMVNK